jgi:hypothetical protein
LSEVCTTAFTPSPVSFCLPACLSNLFAFSRAFCGIIIIVVSSGSLGYDGIGVFLAVLAGDFVCI